MITLAEIAAALGIEVEVSSLEGTRVAGPNAPIIGANSLAAATETDVACLSGEEYLDEFAATRAALVLVSRKLAKQLPDGSDGAGLAPALPRPGILLVDDAELAFAKVLGLLAPPLPRPPPGIHPTAIVAPSARIGELARIGPHVYVGDHARIGRNCIVHCGSYVGEQSTIGDDCELFPNVVIRERVSIGNRVIIHAGAVIGTDGFGYRWDGKRHFKVPQIGTVIIEDDVEIGSCACVDRAKFAATRVGTGTKIDNLVQVAHNVVLGPHCILAGQSGVAGSATLGAGVVLGGQSAVRDHITMGDGSMLAACSGVLEDVKPKAIVSGLPAMPHRQSLREQAAIRRLPELVAQVRKLEDEIGELRELLSKRS